MRYLKGGPKSIGPPRRFLQLGPQGSSPTFSLGPDQPQPLLELALEVQARHRHPTSDLLQDTGFPCSDIILRLRHQALPHLQMLVLAGTFGGFQRQRLLALLELCRVARGHLH